ncbi:OmpA family protein [Phenylobacterium sp.]|jgi:outer membrane protein OmpA-like peptidoglycan-associated protein|uniref:OmpA family protein n=1 Tax=Phenylobacterium sp. TaxID=1871053 RepID=UPI002E32C993|nr:OmpA family protein [Phenylobacterium sp.]HEX4712540.1 OmpA family protein [Phenylobacterium sp.]
MSRSALLPALAVSLICGATLSGCLTRPVKQAPSPAILQARAGQGAKPVACPVADVASVSPVNVGFGFEDAQVDEVAERRLTKAADWLKCNPGVEVVIKPAADSHGTPAHQEQLARARATAVVEQLRARGATLATIRTLAAGAPDPVTAPHLVIEAQGRGW